MQFRPRLTGASGSPRRTTTRPAACPPTPQPVHQKRHGALHPHLMAPAARQRRGRRPARSRRQPPRRPQRLLSSKATTTGFHGVPHLAHPAVINQRHRQYALDVRPLCSLLNLLRHHDQLPAFSTSLNATATRQRVQLLLWRRCSDFWPARPGYRPAS